MIWPMARSLSWFFSQRDITTRNFSCCTWGWQQGRERCQVGLEDASWLMHFCVSVYSYERLKLAQCILLKDVPRFDHRRARRTFSRPVKRVAAKEARVSSVPISSAKSKCSVSSCLRGEGAEIGARKNYAKP